ncbi:class I SAM-dependent methyltransferase [Pseudonocardia alni]|uniref:class I SAM-dependent methyltransferase n=1 Tax=Pseudonocardia alni TaxID=33907 RepID=UPI000C2CAC97|nr:class I SAM-dependent methyltransferase [Pseudonocardia alni]
MPDDEVDRGRTFGDVARAYDDHRPAYPDAAVDAALAGTPERPRVLDLGAGTGKLTRVLTARGLDVVAVEPDPAMLAVLRERSPGVEARTGSAERIPLPDGHVDAVLVGQALHWFDLDRAAPEMARVLRPGGVLAGLWNGGDDDVAWIREFGELTVRGRRVPDNPAGGGDATPHPGSPWFVDDGEDRVTWDRPTTVDEHLADIATHSWALRSAPQDRDAVSAAAREFLTGRVADADGRFTMPMRTIVRRSRKL